MSEKVVSLIPNVSPTVEKQDTAEKTAPPKSDFTLESTSPENSGKIVSEEGVASVPVPNQATEGSTNLPPEPNDSIITFQGVSYASFILTFCLSGFAAVVVFRKALNVSVKRFSIGAKILSLAYLIIAFNSFFGAYLYNKFLSAGDTSVPLTIPILSWILVGPAIAVVLNSLLTREDVPSAKKAIFDAFTYLVIFGFVVASQIPSLGAQEPLVFSFFGAFFFIIPLIRFSISLKMAKAYHSELQEMFVQILIRSLLILPILLPSLVFLNAYELISDGLTMLLFNLATFVFVLMTGLLMVISIDYVTQGISADQLVTKKVDAPATKSDGNLSIPSTQASASPPAPSAPPPAPPSSPTASANKKILKPVPQKPKKSNFSDAPAKSSRPSKEPLQSSSTSFEEFSETLDFDIEQEDSTVIKFNVTQTSEDDSEKQKLRNSKIRPSDSKPSLGKNIKPSQLPKAPQPPDESKSSDSKHTIKPPEKPKKRF
jgi:hypothetical protein